MVRYRRLLTDCNCSGSMGRGIAVEFRKRWPAMYEAYRLECGSGRFQPGGVFVWKTALETIFNLATQLRPGTPARLEYIREAIRKAVSIAERESIPLIAMPRIGSGYGRLEWTDVLSVLQEIALLTSVELVVYELPGSQQGHR